MKKKFFVYVFRHGRTHDNVESRFSGWRDSKLTKSGIDDAKIVAIRLKNKEIPVAFHSSLSRSMDTLKIAIKSHKECQQFIEDDRIIERDYGKFSGQTHLAIVKKYGPDYYDKFHRGFHIRPLKGESFADVEKRVAKFIKSLLVFIKKNQVNVAISAHGNSIRLLRKIIEKRPIREVVSWEISYDHVFTYCVEISGKRVRIYPA